MVAKLDLFEQFADISSKIHRQMERLNQTSVEEKMATMLQMQALSFLMQHTLPTVGELAHYLLISPSSTAQLTDRLTVSKWIEREHDSKDRRIIRLHITKEGEKELQRLKKIKLEKIKKVLSLLPEKELKEIIRINSLLLEKLEQHK
jgi:DNA-binding MarR family transcriptional regulator